MLALHTVQIQLVVSVTHFIEMGAAPCTFQITVQDQRETKFGAREISESFNQATLNDLAKTRNYHLPLNTLEHQDSSADF